MKGSLTILSFFILGVLLGLFRFVPELLITNDYSQWALYVLMFLVGISIGADPNSLTAIKQLNFKILLVPIVTIAGTTMGVAAVYLFLSSDKFLDLLAVGYGFGYYSLSSIFITKLRGDELGVIALLANIMREVITLVAAPIFAVYFGKLAPIVSGGATSMDTTLPIITKSSGKEYAMISIFHGIVLSVLVPFLVTLVLGWG